MQKCHYVYLKSGAAFLIEQIIGCRKIMLVCNKRNFYSWERYNLNYQVSFAGYAKISLRAP